MKRLLVAGLITALLAACAAPLPRLPDAVDPALLRDDWFPRDNRVQKELIPAEQVFALSADLEQALDLQRQRQDEPSRRLTYLMRELFGDDFRDFDYLAAVTTPAAQTFARKGGNCLSLTILAMAMAERLGFSAQMQEVKVPSVWQRTGRYDFVNRHVNVLLRRPANMLLNTLDASSDVIIDFDPLATHRSFAQRQLTRDEVLAMFYNNLAAEAQTRGDSRLAYANLRESLRHYPAFDSAWINLAALYRRQGAEGLQLAEFSLRRALNSNPESYAALSQLGTVLRAQQRESEARAVEQQLAQLKADDPHQQYALAEQAAARGDHRQAVRMLEKAIRRASGYVELHELLARSYAAIGDQNGARREAETAARLRSGAELVSVQFKKLDPLPY